MIQWILGQLPVTVPKSDSGFRRNDEPKRSIVMGLRTFFERLFKKDKVETSDIVSGEGSKLVCSDCRKTFIFEEGEQRFYKMRGLTPPKRCPNCRSKRKHRRR